MSEASLVSGPDLIPTPKGDRTEDAASSAQKSKRNHRKRGGGWRKRRRSFSSSWPNCKKPKDDSSSSHLDEIVKNKNKRRSRRFRQKLRFSELKGFHRETQAAPNNNNEFLMQDHEHYDHINYEGNELLDHNGNISSSSSPEDEDEFISRNFSAAYEVAQTERLNSMSKNELISEYRVLEERIETLEKLLRHSPTQQESQDKTLRKHEADYLFPHEPTRSLRFNTPPESDPEGEKNPKIILNTVITNNDESNNDVSLSEYNLLLEENSRLRIENEGLRQFAPPEYLNQLDEGELYKNEEIKESENSCSSSEDSSSDSPDSEESEGVGTSSPTPLASP